MSGLVVEAGSGLMQFHATAYLDGKPFDGVIWVGKSIPRWQMTRTDCDCLEFFEVNRSTLTPKLKRSIKAREELHGRHFVCSCKGKFIE